MTTDQQILDALANGISQREIIRTLNIGSYRMRRVAAEFNKRLLEQSMTQEAKEPVPQGFHVRKVCHHIKDGESVQQWIHSSPAEGLMFEAQLEALEAVAADMPSFSEVAPPELPRDAADLCTTYVLTDLHLGLYAWENESSVEWDHEKAIAVTKTAIDDMVTGSPDADTGVLAFLGDLCHWDGLLQETVHSRHNLDGSCRFGQLTQIALECILYGIHKAMQKHRTVKVVIAEGNHDESSSIWLRTCLPVMFLNNPRVEFVNNDVPYYAMMHGEHMLAFHHGHKKKDKQVVEVFCAEPKFRKMWGAAARTWVHTGHLHHQAVIEVAGAVVERHPTLSARSSYEARAGYQAWRCAHAITYDKKQGPISRKTVTPRYI